MKKKKQSRLYVEPHQGISHLPASKETCIDMADYRRMGTFEIKLRDQRWIPEFATNINSLRLVILQTALNYSRNSKSIGMAHNVTLERLEQVVAKRLEAHKKRLLEHNYSEHQKTLVEKHIVAVERAGGYIPFITAIAYRAWRLGHDSVTIAAELDITSMSVRQHLRRMLHNAELLGLKTIEPHRSRKSKKEKHGEQSNNTEARKEVEQPSATAEGCVAVGQMDGGSRILGILRRGAPRWTAGALPACRSTLQASPGCPLGACSVRLVCLRGSLGVIVIGASFT